MPLKIDSYLFIFSESRNQLNEFVSDARDEYEALSLERLYPTPEGADGNWKENHWGTPGVRTSVLRYHSNLMLCYYLQTLMLPPLEWLQHIASKYPHLGFFMRYAREDSSMVGGIVAKGKHFYDLAYDDIYIFKILAYNVMNKFIYNKDKRVQELSDYYRELILDQELEVGLM